MARRRYQIGCLFIRGRRRKVWVARWREDVIRPDGTLGRVHRSEVLGLVSEIHGRREAQKLLGNRLRSINQGGHRPQATLTFEQFVRDQWELSVLPILKPSSAQHYSYELHHYLLPAFGPVRLCDFTRGNIQSFLAVKRQQGYSGSSVHGMRTTLSKVLQTAVDWGYLEQNASRGIRIGGRQTTQARTFLIPEQVRRLHDALPEPCRTLVMLAALTGMRIGELLALRWNAIDFTHNSISVRESFYKGQFGSPKTRSSRRDVPMSEPVRKALSDYRTRAKHSGPDGLVFSSRVNTPLNAKNLLRRALQPACRKLELPLVSWHSFRHTHATLLGEVGESVKTAQAILGHSDLHTTLNVYTHVIPESQRRAVAKVADILFPSVPKLAKEGETANGK